MVFFDDHDQILGGSVRPLKGCVSFFIQCDAIRTVGGLGLTLVAAVVDASIAVAPDSSEMFACHKCTVQ